MPHLVHPSFRVKTVLVLTLLVGLMSLPDAAGRWTQLVQPTAHAANNFIVNSTGDGADNNLGDGICNDGSGACTLRAAIEQANNLAGDDTITFSVPLGSIVSINTALPDITGNLTIDGSAANQITVQRTTAVGTPDFRVLKIAPGITLNLTRLKISNGRLASGNSGQDDGGGIHNSGTLTLIGCDISDNRGDFGAGIYNLGSLTIINSSISNNSSIGGAGAGILSAGAGTILNITNSTVANNTLGGGIFIGSGTGTIINSTVSNNTTQGSGGGIVSAGSTILNITNTTITGNRADSPGNTGGVAGGIQRHFGTVTLRNTIVAGNVRGTGTTADDIVGTVDSASSFNLIGIGGSGGLTNEVNSNQVGVTNPGLGALGNEGGPTLTHRLLGGSPAIDAGDNCVLNNSCVPAFPAALTTDQRGSGFPRAVDANGDGTATVDIGAYEVQSILVTNTADSGAGSLRQAITDANAQPDTNAINFQANLTGAITLLTALPDLSTSMLVNGLGSNVLTVQRSLANGTPDFRIFKTTPGTNISIARLTIANASFVGSSPGNLSGNVFNDQGTLVITSCVIKDAVLGSAIANFGGSITIEDSTLSGNNGNGVVNKVPFNSSQIAPASVTINNSTISGNTSSGIDNSVLLSNAGSPATITISNSTISGNNINSVGSGAGIRNGVGSGGTAAITINNSTISGNTNAAGATGGIYNASVFSGPAPTISTVTITNSTIYGNAAGSGSEAAGGIYNILSSCTGCNNAVTLRNTIVAGNTINSGSARSDIFGNVDSGSSFNLIGDGTGASGISNGVNGNKVGTSLVPIDPRLGPLANNGGPTQTHALLPGSPALDAGSSTLAINAGLTTDQRGPGFPRLVDGSDAGETAEADIGAFEAQVAVTDISDQSINEDGSLNLPFNVGGAITSVTATSSDTALVPNTAANISISGSGSSRSLLVTPIPNAFGSLTITVTVNGNNSQSMSDTFTLTINAVNDAPSFTKGPDHSFAENGGSHTLPNWATNLSAGPNESGQTLTFVVTNNTNPGLFAVTPAISANGSTGDLTYTPATGVSGTATITIVLMDDGGTANGGVNTSAPQSFNINVLEGGALAFSAATYSVVENAGTAAITLTRTGGSAGFATVLFTTSNGSATGADYTSVSQTLTFNNGEVSKTVNISITDDLGKEADETINLTLSNAGGSGQLGAQTTAVLTILDNDPVGGYVRFSSANYNTTENAGSTTVTVERVGDTAAAVTVNYFTAPESTTVVPCATVNGIATSRCDFTTALGTLHFAAGETSKTFAVLISQDNYVEGPETITLGISSPTGGAALAAPSAATLTIADDATEPATNPIDDAENFVRQHYHDFLNREPDASGLAFWSNQITECLQPGATCNADERRINVSAAFFLSIEFQETGYLVERLYKAAYGDVLGTSNFGPTHQLPVPVVRFEEFLPDTQQIGKDVVVGVGDWQAKLEANKVAFTQDFVARTRFTTAFSTTLTPSQFVDALFANAGVTPSAAERTSVIGEFGGAGNTADTAARARALRRVAENSTLTDQEKNKAFVLMQYFGYLRRNPDQAPDTDYSGYDFWLTKLNQFNGNFINAEMVKAFITSGEYRQRFGP